MTFAHDLAKKLAERRAPDGLLVAARPGDTGWEVRLDYELDEEEIALLHVIDEGGKEA